MAKTNKKRQRENILYQANRALWKTEKKSTRRIGALTRILNCISQSHKAKSEMRKAPGWIAEKKRARLNAIFEETCTPAYDAWIEFWETVYNFLERFFRDLGGLAIDIANIFIVIGYYLKSLIIYIGDWIADIAYWCEGRKHQLLTAFTAITIAGVAAVIFLTSITAYEYSYYGKTLGIAKSKKIVYDTVEVIADKISKNAGANISLNVERDMEFKKIRGFKLHTDSADDILTTLTYMKDLQVDAAEILVAGTRKVVVEDDEVARNLLQRIKDDYAGEREGVEYTDIHYLSDVTVNVVSVKLGDVWNEKDAERYLRTGSIKDITHVYAKGETISEIASTYGVSEEQIKTANPDLDLNNLEVGTKIALSEPNPIISLASTEVATYYEDIAYGSQYIDNAAIYKGETEVKTPGIPGKTEVIATITRVNGKETSKEVISSKKVSSPVDEVLYRGTKPIPAKLGTGSFALPIQNYSISSHKGFRWGRMHNGIDLAAPMGTKIYAADGGVVTYAGWKGELGYCIIIDHGGLFETLYGHCSKLIVSSGEKVYQGQNIGLVGSTGKSTGAHLHFEVHYNGDIMNPEDYVNF